MIAYMGAAQSYDTPGPQAIYDATMNRIKRIYPSSAYEDLVENHPLTNSAAAFYQQLPFYTVKPLYIGSIYMLHALGIGMAEATYLISIFGFLFIGVLCYFFRPCGLDAGLWWLCIVAFCALGHWPLADLAAWSTPDTLCIALFLLGFCLLLYRHAALGGSLCLLLAQLARPDAALLTVFLMAFFALAPPIPARLPIKHAVGVAGLALALYLLVNKLAGNYGWRTLFYYTYIHKSGFPADTPPLFGINDYFSVLRLQTHAMLGNGRVQILFVLSVFSTVLYRVRPSVTQAIFPWLLWLAWISLVLRFMAFPSSWEDRYYYTYYLVMLYALAEQLGACAAAALSAKFKLPAYSG